MKQTSVYSFGLSIALYITIQVSLQEIEGGIITNQDSLALPAELEDVQTDVASSPSAKNNSMRGRVLYTASYSNVRVSSKEPKPLKYFPSALYTKKLPNTMTTSVVPVFDSTSTTTSKAPVSNMHGVTTTIPQPVGSVNETFRDFEASKKDNGDDIVIESGIDGVTEKNEHS